MQSKLDKLFDDPYFGVGARNHDTGIMAYNDGEILNYITLTSNDHYEVYLSLFDDTRDYLAVSKADDFTMAKQIAINKLDKKINRMIH